MFAIVWIFVQNLYHFHLSSHCTSALAVFHKYIFESDFLAIKITPLFYAAWRNKEFEEGHVQFVLIEMKMAYTQLLECTRRETTACVGLQKLNCNSAVASALKQSMWYTKVIGCFYLWLYFILVYMKVLTVFGGRKEKKEEEMFLSSYLFHYHRCVSNDWSSKVPALILVKIGS